MKNKITLMMAACGFLLASESGRSSPQNTGCTTPPFICECSGSCYEATCTTTTNHCPTPNQNQSGCSCPLAVKPFKGKPRTVYVLPEGALFMCEPSEANPQELNSPAPDGKNWVCPPLSHEKQVNEIFAEKSLHPQGGIIHSFSPGTIFVCGAKKQTPQKVTMSVPEKGLPLEYWACPSPEVTLFRP